MEKYDKLVKIKKWISLGILVQVALKMLFREIRTILGEDNKLSKYGIIGKIYITGLMEMSATTHSMMIKIF